MMMMNYMYVQSAAVQCLIEEELQRIIEIYSATRWWWCCAAKRHKTNRKAIRKLLNLRAPPALTLCTQHYTLQHGPTSIRFLTCRAEMHTYRQWR